MGTNRQHEIDVFQEFLLRASLSIDHASVRSCEPPEPDIRCTGLDGDQYFELARLLDKEMQRMKHDALEDALQRMQGQPGRGPVWMLDYNVKLPEREMLKEKVEKAKRYVTGGLPVDLLLYFDNDNLMAGDVPSAPNPDTHYSLVMKPIIEAQTQFRRVYVFDRHSSTVIYRFPEY